MAHGTLIGGTAYGIGGGKAMVSGTSYKVDKGKVLIGGTAYDITFLVSGLGDIFNGATAGEIKCIAYANGYWVVGGVYAGTTDYYARIAYATSPSGPWTTKDIWTGYSGPGTCVNSIAYGNGHWVAVGCQQTGSTKNDAMYAYASSTPNSYWYGGSSSYALWSYTGSGEGLASASCVTYAEGYWVVGGWSQASGNVGYARIAYTTTPNDEESWTIVDAWSAAPGTYLNCVTYTNGLWVLGGSTRSGSTGRAQVAYAANMGKSWITKQVWTGSSGTRGITSIAYTSGNWVVVGQNYNGSTYYARLACATSLTDTWTTKDLWSGTYNDTALNSVIYADGKWIAVGTLYSGSTYYARLAYATSPSGTWNTQNLWTATSGAKINCVLKTTDYLAIGGQYHDGTNYQARFAYTNDGTNFG